MIYIIAVAWIIGYLLLKNKNTLNLPANMQVVFKGLKMLLFIVPVFIGWFWYYEEVQKPKEGIDEMFSNGAESFSDAWKMTRKGEVSGELIILSTDGKLFTESGNGTWNTDPDNHLIKLHYTDKEKIIKVTKHGYGEFKAELENGEEAEFTSASLERIEEFQKLKQVEFSTRWQNFSLK